jgi:pimeloyl-ACP methyl ester carboxylesterase
MHVEVNGAHLWFDVDGAALVADGAAMRERPTVVLLHGGPGSFDHSYFKPDFSRLADAAQVIYLDLRGHGRSEWGDPTAWSFETCADDVRAFCEALAIDGPVVYGHSLGGFVAMLYAARHAGHPGALVLQSTFARFDLDRIVSLEAFGDAVVDEGYTTAVVAGMGGSSLAPDVLSRTFGSLEGYLELRILDSTDPAYVSATLDDLDPLRTLFLTASKSGTVVGFSISRSSSTLAAFGRSRLLYWTTYGSLSSE